MGGRGGGEPKDSLLTFLEDGADPRELRFKFSLLLDEKDPTDSRSES